MTARKPKIKTLQESLEVSQPAEHEQGTVSEAKPAERLTAEAVAWDLADTFGKTAEVNGNRLTITIPGPNGLVQTFHATVEEGIREF